MKDGVFGADLIKKGILWHIFRLKRGVYFKTLHRLLCQSDLGFCCLLTGSYYRMYDWRAKGDILQICRIIRICAFCACIFEGTFWLDVTQIRIASPPSILFWDYS